MCSRSTRSCNWNSSQLYENTGAHRPIKHELRLTMGSINLFKLWGLVREPTISFELDRFDADGFYHGDRSHLGTTHVRNA